jgi:signal transduction histidine kinase
VTSSSEAQLSATDSLGGGELRLPRQPGVVRRFWGRHPRVSDALLATLWGLIAVSGALRTGSGDAKTSWLVAVAVPLIVIAVAGIFVRRRRPLLAAALSGAAILASVWAPSDIVLVPAIVAVYSVPIYRSVRAGWIVAALIEGAAIVATAIGEALPRLSEGFDPFNPAQGTGQPFLLSLLAFAIQFGIILALALAIGVNIGNRRRYLAALIDRARQLAVERDRQGQLATAAERARIAREMHDIVSHSLTMMIALAEGSAVAADRSAPDAAAAMRKAADTGRDAMIDMRRMLGVLGGDVSAETTPQPGFADLSELVERFRSLGIPVISRVDGPSPEDPAVQLAIYRLVQESLTNAMRYAHGPTEVIVHIALRDRILTASVTDNGLAGFPTEAAGTGRGLLGLRERITSLGGTLAAGQKRDGQGWSVEATLPLNDRAEERRP